MTRLEVLELLLEVSQSLFMQATRGYEELTADDLMRVVRQFIERERSVDTDSRSVDV